MSRSAAFAVLAIALVVAAVVAYLALQTPADEVGRSSPSPFPSRSGRVSASPAPTASGVPSAVDASPSPKPEIVFVGAGDIADCDSSGDEATAALLHAVVEEHPEAVVFTAGDNAYPDGSRRAFDECYGPSWGRHRERTRPAVGNHEFAGGQAGAGHRAYFGEASGPADRFYYSYDLDGWHVVVLNSQCDLVGCTFDAGPGDQAEWLAADLEASRATCTIAIWHHPRWSSGARYGNDPRSATFWDLLYEHGAEIVLNGHEHVYERFEPMTPAGDRDDVGGIRQFTVGTGGAGTRGFADALPTSAARGADIGLLMFTLGEAEYRWEFLSADGSFTDAGLGTCH